MLLKKLDFAISQIVLLCVSDPLEALQTLFVPEQQGWESLVVRPSVTAQSLLPTAAR